MQMRPIGPGFAWPFERHEGVLAALAVGEHFLHARQRVVVRAWLTLSSPPRQSERLWWQPEAETPMKGLVMKQAIRSNSRATWAQICR